MKFGFYTLGCKVNLFETQALMHLAQSRGHEICTQDADAFILNTCSVTEISERKNLRALHKIRRENPRAILVACGCFAQLNPERLAVSGEVDLICGTSQRADIILLCERAAAGLPIGDLAVFRRPGRIFEPLPAGIPAGRTRALLKVQDGCDNYCTYCIIPYTRGHIRSLPADAAVSEARRLAGEGVHEIVLTGIEISSYGRDLPGKPDLCSLVEQICDAVPDVQLRLGSLEPRTVTEEFCARLADKPNLAFHFHLSLQSGCDAVLRRMHRRYTAADFADRVALLRRFFPDCSVTTDVIVGFPGETEAEFAETCAFLRAVALDDVHVFPYSARPGTPAAQMPDQLPIDVKNERANLLRQLCAEISRARRQNFIGQELEVLIEHPAEGGWSGHSRYAFPVLVQGEGLRKNARRRVHITQVTENGLRGTAVL